MINLFFSEIKELLEIEVGTVTEKNGVLRAIADDVGLDNGKIILEVCWAEDQEEGDFKVLQIYSTLAQNIEEDVVPAIQNKLVELNSITLLGYYGYYSKLHQIFHTYRIPVDTAHMIIALDQIRYCLDQIRYQFEIFYNYVVLIADNPEEMELGDYMEAMNAIINSGEES